ncbi:MAG: TPM domain-containing protein [Xanthobacteraceae bacterium]
MRFARSGMAAGFAAALLFSLVALAALDFPPLTGRVVDQANIMTPESRSELETKLKDLEDKSGIQLVVATVKSLQGGDIETYANELFRTWKLGQAQKNNGVLLLIAPNEHKVRIEVGYGLEGALPDALSSVIISSAIVPRFKAGDFSGGISRGVDGIISVLSGDTSDWQRKVDVRQDDPESDFDKLFPILFFLLIFFVCWYLIRNAGGGGPSSGGTARRAGPLFIPYGGSSWGGGFGGGGFGGGGFGGGFGGGGGSSGGGGASGGW